LNAIISSLTGGTLKDASSRVALSVKVGNTYKFEYSDEKDNQELPNSLRSIVVKYLGIKGFGPKLSVSHTDQMSLNSSQRGSESSSPSFMEETKKTNFLRLT